MTWVAFFGLILTTFLVTCCCTCGDFMRNQNEYSSFIMNCKYMNGHKFPYIQSNEWETDHRCYCRYFEFMNPSTFTPVFVIIMLSIIWLSCLKVFVTSKVDKVFF